VLNRSKYEGFVRQDRALYIDDWESDYLMIDSVGQTVPKSVKDRTAWNRAYHRPSKSNSVTISRPKSGLD